MGILDEAIRQHLDLKRRQGAPDDELKRLEDEAFGPPTRPGEPDFPEQAPEGAGEDGGGEKPEAQAPTDAPAGEVEAPPASDAPPEAESAPPAVEEPFPSEREQAPSGLEESTETQPAAPIESEQPPTEAEVDLPPGDAGGEPAIFDHVEEEGIEVGEIELDLEEGHDEVRELDESASPPAEPEGEPEPGATGVEPAEAAEPPIESLPTVEHPMEDEISEPLPGEGPEPEDSGAEQPEGEDVLEETPEFLKDAPEYDELWFEQREPKDFDF
jgi:hypothetical protein